MPAQNPNNTSEQKNPSFAGRIASAINDCERKLEDLEKEYFASRQKVEEQLRSVRQLSSEHDVLRRLIQQTTEKYMDARHNVHMLGNKMDMKPQPEMTNEETLERQKEYDDAVLDMNYYGSMLETYQQQQIILEGSLDEMLEPEKAELDVDELLAEALDEINISRSRVSDLREPTAREALEASIRMLDPKRRVSSLVKPNEILKMLQDIPETSGAIKVDFTDSYNYGTNYGINVEFRNGANVTILVNGEDDMETYLYKDASDWRASVWKGDCHFEDAMSILQKANNLQVQEQEVSDNQEIGDDYEEEEL